MGSATTPKESPPALDWMVRLEVGVVGFVDQGAEKMETVKCLYFLCVAEIFPVRAAFLSVCVYVCVCGFVWSRVGICGIATRRQTTVRRAVLHCSRVACPQFLSGPCIRMCGRKTLQRLRAYESLTQVSLERDPRC